jgi:hypothetical protein
MKGPRIQPRLSTGERRVPIHSSSQRALQQAIAHTAQRFAVSRSWVVAVALGHYFGIDVVSFEEATPQRLRRVR